MRKLTTHVLDTVNGLPAAGLVITLWRREDTGDFTKISSFTTNDDGRVDTPLLAGDGFQLGTYRLVFHAGDYLQIHGGSDFLDQIPIDFTISDKKRHYHVPLLLSLYSYSTYRGS